MIKNLCKKGLCISVSRIIKNLATIQTINLQTHPKYTTSLVATVLASDSITWRSFTNFVTMLQLLLIKIALTSM